MVVAPDEGRMTGSDVGIGRYPEVNKIIEIINLTAHITADLAGKKLLITAGGTREPIDPIRFIGNRSSGKQGFALAMASFFGAATLRDSAVTKGYVGPRALCHPTSLPH